MTLSLAIFVGIVVLAGCSYRPINRRIVLPDGYIGWVRVDFAANSPPPTDATNFITFKIGNDGYLPTDGVMISSVGEKLEFLYETSEGLKPIPEDFVDSRFDAGGITASSGDPRLGLSWYFFIGPKSYRQAHPTKDFISHTSPLPTPGRFLFGLNPHDVASAQNTTSMPSDPAEILALGVKLNNLDGPDLQPWHIKVAYQTFDDGGHADASGTYEEFWVARKKSKAIFAGSKFSQTDYSTDGGLYRSGAPEWPDRPEMMVITDVLHPMPVLIGFRDFELKKRDRSFGITKLLCIALKPRETNPNVVFSGRGEPYPHYCFDRDQPVLRFSNLGDGMFDTSYDNLVEFQGRHIARDIKVSNDGKPVLTLHIDTLEGLSSDNGVDFTPAPEAFGPLIGKIIIPPQAAAIFRLTSVPPDYPSSAKQAHIQGKVVVRLTIGKDGHVINQQAVSGPSDLQRSAIDSVRKWVFRPFWLMGEPLEVESTIEITFALDR
jgi:TonB family protein